MFNQVALILLALVGAPPVGEEIDVPFEVKGCPFEGCAFGKWTVTRDTIVFQKPTRESLVAGTLKKGDSVNVISGIEYITPGIAAITGKPYSHKEIINPDQIVLILNYLGEGRSQVFHDGHLFITKIARKKSRCNDKPNWRYCWVEVIQEPIGNWWVQIENLGWVSMGER